VLILTGTHNLNQGLSRLLHTELHWLNIPERVTHKLGHVRLPAWLTLEYLIDYCLPVSDEASLQHLRSASQHHLLAMSDVLMCTKTYILFAQLLCKPTTHGVVGKTC